MSFQDYADSTRSRLHLGNMNPKLFVGVAAIILFVLGFVFFNLNSVQKEDGFAIQRGDEVSVSDTDSEAETSQPLTICVHVGGCVSDPGIRYLKEGSRVADAIEACGGLSIDANADSINLARIIQDGEQIIVPGINDSTAVGTSVPTAVSSADSAASGSKVNINQADETQLQTLNGIGESKAKKIIAYRNENGSFKSIEDLTNVSGIGQKTFESLKDDICV